MGMNALASLILDPYERSARLAPAMAVSTKLAQNGSPALEEAACFFSGDLPKAAINSCTYQSLEGDKT
jgi:hypothetical protein